MLELSAAERRHLKFKTAIEDGSVRPTDRSGEPVSDRANSGAALGPEAEFAGILPVVVRPHKCDRGSPVSLVLGDDGGPLLDLPFRLALTGRRTVGIGAIWALPLMRVPLIASISKAATGRAQATVCNYAGAAVDLARGIAAVGGVGASSETLPTDLFARIHAEVEARTGSPMTVPLRKRLNVARELLGRIPGCSHVDVESERLAKSLPNDTAGISGDVDLELLLKGCAARIGRLVEEQLRLSSRLKGVAGPEDADERIELAAFLVTAYPAGPPAQAALAKAHPTTMRRVRAVGYRSICRIAWPSAPDMVAVAALLGIQTRFNPGILSGLPVGAFSPEPGEGGDVDQDLDDPGAPILEDDLGQAGAPPEPGDRIVAAPYKPRASRIQPVSFPASADPWGPAVLVEFVRAWTAPIRDHAGALAGDLFIYAREGHALTISSFATQRGANLQTALNGLSDDLGLSRRLRIKDLRLIGVDIVHESTGGDPLMIRAAGWWRSLATGVRHYLGGPARLRDEERLIWGIKLERRRMDWGIDVAGRPDGADLFSATDGFRCGDPLRGPIAQSPGELCRARGLCPICPHADVDVAAPAWSFAQMVGLADHLQQELEEGDRGARWRARWRPVLADLLDLWLPLFPDAVVEDARRLPTMPIEGLYHD